RDRLPEVPGLKIAVMGCIVNGPGEMADADFGVMGSKNGTLTIYRGKTPVKKHLNPKDAAEELFRLLKQSDWIKD
ncbi:MAG: flavodoxin-dependent (E)-4-hydroxy-3-methylbut-2-enyl-diphosphate synthase, partial [Bacteroidales bacterium]